MIPTLHGLSDRIQHARHRAAVSGRQLAARTNALLNDQHGNSSVSKWRLSKAIPWGPILSMVLTSAVVGLPIYLGQTSNADLSPASLMPLIVAIVAVLTYSLGTFLALLGLGVSTVLFCGWYARDWSRPLLPANSTDSTTLALYLISGVAMIWLVRRIGLEGSADRQETLAARSAATALSAIETVAATQHDLTPEAEAHLHDAIVRAVVSVNRVHGGALILIDEQNDDGPTLKSSYGFGEDGGQRLLLEGTGEKLIDAVSRERRVIQIRIPGDQRHLRLSEARSGRMKALMAAPVMTEDQQLAGVLVVGLLVDHQFSPSEIRRLSALASQVATILETMSVTSEREAQLRHAQNEQKQLERVIAAVPEALVICAPPDGRVIAINEAARSLFRGDEHALTMDTVRPIGPDASSVDLPLVATLASSQPVGDVECVVEHDDGSVTPVLASAAPISDLNGTMLAVVTSFRDITNLKEASRIRDEFVSVVSHELRSPLTPIRGFVQLVARELARKDGHELQVNRLNSIAGHVDRLTRLVDDLLDVSSLRSGTLEIRTERADLIEICEQVVSLRRADEASNHSIEFQTRENHVPGDWDRDRIHQIMDNLIGNALKYSPEGSAVHVNVSLDEGVAQASVRDEGSGIAPDLQDEIFGAFYRTPDVTAGQIPGLGLGLYICQALAHAHGGSIDYVQSEDPAGSEFRLRLPAIVDTVTQEPDVHSIPSVVMNKPEKSAADNPT